jgi:hypothetical protein
LEDFTHSNDGDTPLSRFRGQLCHEMLSAMRTPRSYSSVFFDLAVLCSIAQLNNEAIETAEWQATFRCERLPQIIDGRQ